MGLVRTRAVRRARVEAAFPIIFDLWVQGEVVSDGGADVQVNRHTHTASKKIPKVKTKKERWSKDAALFDAAADSDSEGPK